ncbi:MAG: hypothetical protein ACUVRS_07645 [Armatimonadota bacterium]
MKRIVVSGISTIFLVLASAAWSFVIDDFETGDLSTWQIEAPYYTTLSLTSPGA